MDSLELAKTCVRVAVDKKATDPLIIDLQGRTILADYFVIVTINNDRHAKAVRNEIVDAVKDIKRKAVPVDGSSGWVVLDLGTVIVHLFVQHLREYYNLEELWKKCDFIRE